MSDRTAGDNLPRLVQSVSPLFASGRNRGATSIPAPSGFSFSSGLPGSAARTGPVIGRKSYWWAKPKGDTLDDRCGSFEQVSSTLLSPLPPRGGVAPPHTHNRP